MPYYSTLEAFYTGREWREFREVIIAQRMKADGLVYDEITGKPIVLPYDIILHHVIPLTLDNVNDASISLNPANIQIVSFKTHNQLHNRFGTWTRHIYLVHGSPLAGKSSFVKERADIHDLIVDMDAIYAAVSNNPPYVKSERIYENVKGVYDCLLDSVKVKRGKWVNAFVIAGMPFKGERERFVTEYGAEEIHIDTDKETCLLRLDACTDGRNKADWKKYIEKYWNQYSA